MWLTAKPMTNLRKKPTMRQTVGPPFEFCSRDKYGETGMYIPIGLRIIKVHTINHDSIARRLALIL